MSLENFEKKISNQKVIIPRNVKTPPHNKTYKNPLKPKLSTGGHNMADHPGPFPENNDLNRIGAAAPAPDVERLLDDYQLASRIAAAETESLTIYPLDSMLSNAPDTRPRASLIYDARSNQTKFFPDVRSQPGFPDISPIDSSRWLANQTAARGVSATFTTPGYDFQRSPDTRNYTTSLQELR